MLPYFIYLNIQCSAQRMTFAISAATFLTDNIYLPSKLTIKQSTVVTSFCQIKNKIQKTETLHCRMKPTEHTSETKHQRQIYLIQTVIFNSTKRFSNLLKIQGKVIHSWMKHFFGSKLLSEERVEEGTAHQWQSIHQSPSAFTIWMWVRLQLDTITNAEFKTKDMSHTLSPSLQPRMTMVHFASSYN